MTTHKSILIVREVQCPPLAKVVAFLTRTGWCEIDRDEHRVVYEATEAETYEVRIPPSENVYRYESRIADLISSLAAYAPHGTNEEHIYDAIMREDPAQ